MISLKKKVLITLLIVSVVALLLIPFLFAKSVSIVDFSQRKKSIPIYYSIMSTSAIFILIGYCVSFKKKYFWLLMTMISVCICNIGYLALSLSANLSEALLANKIAYFGNCFLPFFLLITIADICRFRYKKFLTHLLFSISFVMFIFTTTTGYLDIFYKTISFEVVDGIVKINKIYGFMHTVYAIYIGVYFLLMLILIIYSERKKKIISKKQTISLFVLVFINVLLWFFEKIYSFPIEALSFSYVISSGICVFLYQQLKKFGLLNMNNISLRLTSSEERKTFINIADDSENKERNELLKYTDQELSKLFKSIPVDSPLSDREIEIGILMIRNVKRKKIADLLFITEHTVKFHISNIYKKTEVNTRAELIELLINQ